MISPLYQTLEGEILMKVNRRNFIASSAAGVVAVSTTAKSFANIMGANDRILMGFIGLGGMGQYNLKDFLQMKDVSVAAVCDVWEHNLSVSSKLTETQPSAKPRNFRFPQLLEIKEIDAVLIATPDHGTFPTIQACRQVKMSISKPLAYVFVRLQNGGCRTKE
jgi:hypothetical protein